jgi:hypothetical protein
VAGNGTRRGSGFRRTGLIATQFDTAVRAPTAALAADDVLATGISTPTSALTDPRRRTGRPQPTTAQNCTFTEMGVWSENSLDRTVVVAVYGKPQ